MKMVWAGVWKFSDGGFVLEIYKSLDFGMAVIIKNIKENDNRYVGIHVQVFNILFMFGWSSKD